MDEIKVSIICNAYNHEKYIRSALDGFIMQKTNFYFEVLVHDDASTDHTAEIIKEYEKKYPEVIKPIYETENQHSKPGDSVGRIQYGRAKGEYIALCEGDDYWNDPNKLQMQVDYMDSHPQCIMSCHNSIRYYCNTGKQKLENPYKHQGNVSAGEIIYPKSNSWPATSSLLYRRKILDNKPSFFSNLPVGDYPIRLYAYSCGDVYYMDKVMSVYRFMSEGSWTIRHINRQRTDKTFEEKMIGFLEKYNDYTNHKYEEPVNKAIDRYKYLILKNGSYKEICKSPYYKTLTVKKKMKLECVRAYIFVKSFVVKKRVKQ